MNRLVHLFTLFVLIVSFFSCNYRPPENNAVSAKLFNYPVLKGKENNPFFRV